MKYLGLMAQVCNMTPNDIDNTSFIDFIALVDYCEGWKKIKEKVREW